MLHNTDNNHNPNFEFDAFIFFYENNLSFDLINQMNKCDVNIMSLTELKNHQQFLREQLHYFKPNNKKMKYFEISAKTCYNFDKPFVGLIQLLAK